MSFAAYLKDTDPVWLIVSYPYSHGNLKGAMIDLHNKHLKQVKNYKGSQYKNYLIKDLRDYISLTQATQKRLFESIYGKRANTPSRISIASNGPLGLLDCIFFEAGTKSETVFIHKARLLALYAEVKIQEIDEQIGALSQVSKKVE